MGAWRFVALAYGIVWGVILVYLYNLKRRYNRAAAELAELESTETSAGNAKK
jgi:CcmD family protein